MRLKAGFGTDEILGEIVGTDHQKMPGDQKSHAKSRECPGIDHGHREIPKNRETLPSGDRKLLLGPGKREKLGVAWHKACHQNYLTSF